MKVIDIAVGGRYRSNNGHHAGLRIVERIYLNFHDAQWPEWRNPEASQRREGSSHGVSSVELFANWEDRSEPAHGATAGEPDDQAEREGPEPSGLKT